MTNAHTRRLNAETRRIRRALSKGNPNAVRKMERAVKAERRAVEGAGS